MLGLSCTIVSFFAATLSGVYAFAMAKPGPIALDVIFLVSVLCFLTSLTATLALRAARSLRRQSDLDEHEPRTTAGRQGGGVPTNRW
jgi:hypothetical protein